jgi:hypothetical protein
MRISLLIVWGMLLTQAGRAQSLFTGQVTDSVRRPLPGIHVTLHPRGGTTILAFALTDAEGRFRLTGRAGPDTVVIKAYGLGWAAQQRELMNRTQVIDFSLTEKPTELKEVIVKPPPITRRGDTLSYRVEAFKSQSDRVLADVLRKMPGLEVEADGRILYQGKPINKYYIEGLDLLETRYRLANDNLPADAVAQVEVLENHQPIRMLDSLVFSDRAALNIRLKNNIALTGTAHLGAGAAPLLWDANLTPMLFTRRNQVIASYQANNTGANVARQLKSMAPGTVFNPLQNDEEKKDWLMIQPLATPPFEETRWLDNRIHLGTVNALKKLARDFEIRWNLSYVNDVQQQRGGTRTTYYTPTDTIDLTERTHNTLFAHSLKTHLTLQRNNRTSYFKNQFSAQAHWDDQRGLISLNSVPITQELSNPFFRVSNELSHLIRVGKQMVSFQSTTALSRAPQSLTVSPGLFTELLNEGVAYRQLRQEVLATSLTTDISLTLTKRAGRFTLLPEAGVGLETQKLGSTLRYGDGRTTETTTDDFTNQLDWFKLNAYMKLKIQYRKDAWRLELDSPLTYYRFALADPVAGKGQQLGRLVPEPRFSAHYALNSFWEANASLGYRNRFGEMEDIHYGYLLRTYRTLQRRDVPLQENWAVSSLVGLHYRNPLTALFGSFTFTHSASRNNLLYSSLITPTGALEYSAINQVNSSHIQLLSGRLSKYFAPIKTTITTSMGWSTMAREQLLNGALTTVTNERITPGLKMIATFGKWMDVEYDGSLSWFKTRLSESSTQTTSQQKHLLKLNGYPSRTSYVSLENEFYVNNLTTTGVAKNLFTSALLRYTISKSRIDLEMRCSNLWNTSTLTTAALNSFSAIESVYQLRPRQVVQKIRFSF